MLLVHTIQQGPWSPPEQDQRPDLIGCVPTIRLDSARKGRESGGMMRRTTFTRSAVSLSLGLALVAASCSSDDGAGEESGGGETIEVVATTPDESAGSGDDDGSNGEVAATGSLTVAGAIDASLEEADEAVAFRAGGGCFGGSFQMSVKVDVDGRTVYDVIVPDLTGVDGSTTGEFPTDVEVYYYDPDVAAFDAEEFVGVGTVTIVEQRPDDRAFEYEVTGSFESEDDSARTIDVDFGYVAPIICS